MTTTKRIALVTGGMGGLGEAICIKFAALGDTVVTTYSPEQYQVEAMAGGDEGGGPAVSRLSLRCDDWASCDACIERDAGSRAGGCAGEQCGHHPRHDVQKMDKVNWDAVMHANLDSVST
jgi:acetoacetyl-CoA reductase